MFKPSTVFIVGAGASSEVGLPVGTELAKQIAESLFYDFDPGVRNPGDQVLLESWKNYFHPDGEKLNEHLRAARQIHDGIFLAKSIDNYLHQHDGNDQIKFCGKTAIVRMILDAEHDSLLSIPEDRRGDPIDLSKVKDTWYVRFAEALMAGRQKEDLKNLFDGISIICFNYDRCIQHFLRYAISSLYAVTLAEAEEVVSKLKIFHPYGTVGDLKTSLNLKGVPFGILPHNSVIELSDGIKTFNEQIDDADTLRRIRSEIANAKQLVFLGFGFHQQNMEILMPDREKKGLIKAAFATALRVSDYDCDEIIKRIYKLNKGSFPDIQIKNDLMCAPLLNHFQMSL